MLQISLKHSKREMKIFPAKKSVISIYHTTNKSKCLKIVSSCIGYFCLILKLSATSARDNVKFNNEPKSTDPHDLNSLLTVNRSTGKRCCIRNMRAFYPRSLRSVCMALDAMEK